MANWKQVQGRIRRAKASSDAAGQLTQLYESTRDAMVAFELARVLEKNHQLTEAVSWYRTAAERFRRDEWRQKAIDAIAALGGTPPTLEELAAAFPHPPRREPAASGGVSGSAAPEGEAGGAGEEAASAGEPSPESAPAGPPAAPGEKKKRTRRGRRGGRGRRKRGPGEAPTGAAPGAAVEPAAPRLEPAPRREPPAPFRLTPPEPPEPAAPSGISVQPLRGKSGDPAMSSRLALLESQLRRLIAAPQYPLDRADEAPAGPGVFLLSDSDQVTHYYIEACRTLRIAAGQLTKGERARRGSGFPKKRLAEHLGIGEAKVSKYLKDHCTVRWLQLDTDAQFLAHFAIAVLRPALNIEEE